MNATALLLVLVVAAPLPVRPAPETDAELADRRQAELLTGIEQELLRFPPAYIVDAECERGYRHLESLRAQYDMAPREHAGWWAEQVSQAWEARDVWLEMRIAQNTSGSTIERRILALNLIRQEIGEAGWWTGSLPNVVPDHQIYWTQTELKGKGDR